MRFWLIRLGLGYAVDALQKKLHCVIHSTGSRKSQALNGSSGFRIRPRSDRDRHEVAQSAPPHPSACISRSRDAVRSNSNRPAPSGYRSSGAASALTMSRVRAS